LGAAFRKQENIPMRNLLLAAGAALTLAACGGGETQSNEMAADNAMMNDMMMNDAAAMNGMDANMTMDANGTMGANGTMDANAAMDANTQNAMMKDATTNDPDTNLANGM
jgi:hypothetical protein